MLDSVIAEANHDVDVTLRRRRNTDVPIDDPVIDMKLDRQDQHLIDTDKFECVTDYKWIILYFISLNFIVF
jgi:hypothetical protein